MALGTASSRSPSPSSASPPSRPSREETRIPDDFVEEARSRADVVSIVRQRVELKKQGANLVGLCPFHKEKSPSFTVSETKQIYHCFGCGASGDALSFLMEHDGLAFRDAVKECAESAGLVLPPALDPTKGGAPAINTSPLYRAMEQGQDFFRFCLKHDVRARQYLRSRGLTLETINRFAIGYAPAEWRGLQEVFKDYNANADILSCGLVREKENEDGSKRRYDFFRDRIMFPLRDTRGRIISFGGRVIDKDESSPKYMNSPDSPIFNKSSALFGLHEAQQSIREHKLVLAVEGYMDVAMLSQHGVGFAVACMGTSMTKQHIERLFTQATTLVFCFDGDAAGQKAAWRALETVSMVMEDGHDIRFLVLPEGLDPDEFIQRDGRAAFLALVRQAPSYSEFMFSTLRARHGELSTPEQRARFAEEAHQVVERLGYRLRLRKILLGQIAQEAQVPGSALAAMRQERSHRRSTDTLWSRLASAVNISPQTALEYADVLLSLIDPTQHDEVALLNVLQPITEGILPAPGSHSEADLLAARDLLANSVNLIIELREKEALSELKAAFQRGELTEAEYLAQSLALSGS